MSLANPLVLFIVLIAALFMAACSSGSTQLLISEEPVFAKVSVTNVILSEDEGMELTE